MPDVVDELEQLRERVARFEAKTKDPVWLVICLNAVLLEQAGEAAEREGYGPGKDGWPEGKTLRLAYVDEGERND